jgi:predicted ATP-grasp superfamily ATP-dependent carboligase
MRIGAFELREPLADVHEPHVLTTLRPWIDVGSVGTLTFALLEDHLQAHRWGQLAKPGTFFDFTRYRPAIRLTEGARRVIIPNTFIDYAKSPDGRDFLLFYLLEPTMLGDVYVKSILRVMRTVGARSYCLVGSMYDAVPHTKPLIVSGSVSGVAEEELRGLGIQPSDYEGPTTIAILVSQEAPKDNIEVSTLIVHLPQYTGFEEDYGGVLRLLEILCSLYRLPMNLDEVRTKAQRQYEQLSQSMGKDPGAKRIIEELEAHYEARLSQERKEAPKLSPEIERFLRDLSYRWNSG